MTELSSKRFDHSSVQKNTYTNIVSAQIGPENGSVSRVLAVRSCDLNLILGIYMVKRQN